jgi:hypothetical protein
MKITFSALLDVLSFCSSVFCAIYYHESNRRPVELAFSLFGTLSQTIPDVSPFHLSVSYSMTNIVIDPSTTMKHETLIPNIKMKFVSPN